MHGVRWDLDMREAWYDLLESERCLKKGLSVR